MLTTLALLTATALPQDRSHPGSDPLRHAGLMPGSTLIAVELAPSADYQAELEQTALWTSLQEALDQPACRDLLGALRAPISEKDGEGIRGIDLLGLGVSIALAPTNTGNDWGITAIVEGGTLANRLSAALDERAARVKGGIEKKSRNGTPSWLFTLGGRQFAVAMAGTTILLGSPPDQLDAALERRGGRSTDILGTQPVYLGFTEHTRGHLHPGRALTVFCNVSGVMSNALAAAPALVRNAATRWLGRIGLDGIGAAGFVVDVADGRVRERAILDLPSPRPPLLAAMFPERGQVGLDAATLAPRDIAAFSSMQSSVRDLYIELMKLIDAVEPKVSADIRRTLHVAGEQLGIDIEADLIYGLGSRIVSMQWPSPDGTRSGDWVYVIDTDRPERMVVALGRLTGFEGGKLGAFDLFIQQGGGLGVAVGKGALIVTDSERTLRRWLGDQRVPTPHPEVRGALLHLTDGGIGCGWINLRSLMSDALRAVDRYGSSIDRNSVGHRMLSRVATALTPLTWFLYTEPRGISLHFESTSGFITQLFLSGLVGAAEEALNDPAISRLLDATQSSENAREVRIAQVLAAVQIAEKHYFDKHQTYANLDTLAKDEALDADLFEGRQANGTRVVGDALATILVRQGSEPHWVAVVWPAERRTGEVFAVSDQHGPMRNELVARSRGLLEPMWRDVFNRGEIAQGLTPGWRAMDLTATDTESAPALPASSDAAMLGIIAALEKRGSESANEILKYVESENPRVVARAVYALGKLRATAAVPRMLEIASGHPNVEVRQQTMRALLQFGDRRSVQTSIQLLGDPDPVVRTLAATNLGRLKATEASDALVALASKVGPNNEGDDAAAAALIALGELGDPGVLLRAAGAWKVGGKKSEEAIVWLFQTLSPTLENNEEAKTLMGTLDHDSTMLRRYSIQRLGELKNPNTVAALESRLAVETDQLRPLVEVSLASVRGVMVGAQESGFAATARTFYLNAKAYVVKAWADPKIRVVMLATSSGLVVAVIGLLVVSRRQRRRRQGEDWAARAREVGGPAPRSQVRLRPRYEDYKPEYDPENWDAEISQGEEDDWPVEEEWSESAEATWQDEQVDTRR